MHLSNNFKGWFSIIGAIIFQIGLGGVFPLGNFNVYIISYINSFNPHSPYSLAYGYFILPIITIIMGCITPLGGIVDHMAGLHVTILVGTTVLICGCALMYFVNSIWMMYLALFIYGAGTGICFITSMKNACLYFPKQKGIISATMIACGGIGGAFYTFFGESMINPDNIQLNEGEMYYDYSIAKNTLNFYIFQALAFITTAGLAMLLIFQFHESSADIQIPTNEQKLIHDTSTMSNKTNEEEEKDKNDESIPETVKDIEKDNDQAKERIKNPHYKSDMKKVLSSKRLWLLFASNFFTGFLFFEVSIMFKVIGTMQKFSITALKIGTTGGALGMTIFSPIWGLLYDFVGFKPLIMVINIIGISLGITICFSLNNEILFVILLLLDSALIAGNVSVFQPHTMKVFGIKYLIELGGILGFAPGLSNVLGSIFAFIVTNYSQGNTSVFYISYICGAVFNLISIIITCFENDTLFDYGRSNESQTGISTISETDVNKVIESNE